MGPEVDAGGASRPGLHISGAFYSRVIYFRVQKFTGVSTSTIFSRRQRTTQEARFLVTLLVGSRQRFRRTQVPRSATAISLGLVRSVDLSRLARYTLRILDPFPLHFDLRRVFDGRLLDAVE